MQQMPPFVVVRIIMFGAVGVVFVVLGVVLMVTGEQRLLDVEPNAGLWALVFGFLLTAVEVVRLALWRRRGRAESSDREPE